jgi:hypothetical protein
MGGRNATKENRVSNYPGHGSAARVNTALNGAFVFPVIFATALWESRRFLQVGFGVTGYFYGSTT